MGKKEKERKVNVKKEAKVGLKKGGRKGGIRAQLAHLGLCINTVNGDGNCFFRSLSDQLYGDEDHHLELRKKVTEYMTENEEFYKLFLEDDEPWEKYIKRMRKEGSWAGNIELQVASVVCDANIVVHQEDQAPYIVSSGKPTSKWLHLLYKFELHYDSVRETAAPTGPTDFPSWEVLTARAAGSAAEGEGGDAGADEGAEGRPWTEEDEEYVASCVPGVDDVEVVRAALRAAGGDRDQAIESLIAGLCDEDDHRAQQQPQASSSAAKEAEVPKGEAAEAESTGKKKKKDKAATCSATAEEEPVPTHSYNLRSTARRRKEAEEREAAAATAATPPDAVLEPSPSPSLVSVSLLVRDEGSVSLSVCSREGGEGDPPSGSGSDSDSSEEEQEAASTRKTARRKERKLTKAEKKAAKKALKAKERQKSAAKSSCSAAGSGPNASNSTASVSSLLNAIHI